MTKKTLAITIGCVEDAARDVIDVWHRAERGETPAKPQAEILFTDLETLLRTLTLQRCSLLQQLYKLGPTDIQALAKTLGRNCKNVHRDITELLRLGLIEKNEAGEILVPWDEIDARLDLAA